MDTRIVLNKRKSKMGFIYTLQCIYCRKPFDLHGYKFNEGKGKYCSLKCANLCPKRVENLKNALPDITGVNNPNYKTGHCLYVKQRKSFCEICKITFDEIKKRRQYKRNPLEVHHKDHDRMNSNCLNLMTVCNSCHATIHKRGSHRKRNTDGTFQ